MKRDRRVKLLPAQVLTIRRRYANRAARRVTYRSLAKMFGVDSSTVHQIVKGHSRKTVGGPVNGQPDQDAFTRAHGHYNGRAKLTARQVRRIRRRYSEQSPRVTQKQIAEQYGISGPMVHYIVRRKKWRYLG